MQSRQDRVPEFVACEARRSTIWGASWALALAVVCGVCIQKAECEAVDGCGMEDLKLFAAAERLLRQVLILASAFEFRKQPALRAIAPAADVVRLYPSGVRTDTVNCRTTGARVLSIWRMPPDSSIEPKRSGRLIRLKGYGSRRRAAAYSKASFIVRLW